MNREKQMRHWNNCHYHSCDLCGVRQNASHGNHDRTEKGHFRTNLILRTYGPFLFLDRPGKTHQGRLSGEVPEMTHGTVKSTFLLVIVRLDV